MIIRGGLPGSLQKLLMKIFDEEDKSTWPQVNKLKAEDVIKLRGRMMYTASVARELRSLKVKMTALEAQSEVATTEWWDHLHKAYALPAAGSYHVTDDGRILMRPREKE